MRIRSEIFAGSLTGSRAAVVIEPVSNNCLRKNGNLSECGRRLSAISASGNGDPEPWRLIEFAKSPEFRAAAVQVVNCSELQDWVAGDAVLIAPVSSQIACKQGILQGIERFWPLGDTELSNKLLQMRGLSANSLLTLTGNYFLFSGKLAELSGNAASSPAHWV